MRRAMLFLIAFCVAVPAFADRPILLVTPDGVWKADVVNGVPGEWKSIEIDVIVRGFTPGQPTPPDKPDVPDVPVPSDPIVTKISELAKSTLKDQAEATAVSALIDALSKMGLSGEKLKQAIETAAPIADVSMQSKGRITKFFTAAIAVTVDASKLKSGITAAWDVSQASLDTIRESAEQQMNDPDAPLTAEALDFLVIIKLIQDIVQLLINLGIIKT